MEKLTIKDIANKAGVGISTVSRALNNHPDISLETKNKVMQVVDEYGFVPNTSARNLKRTQSKTIVIIIKGIDNPLFSSMINVFEKAINEKEYSFFLRHVDTYENEIDIAIRLVNERKLKGVVFLGGYFKNSEEKLKKLNVPFVVSTVNISKTLNENMLACSISIDDEAESFRMVDYLCSIGHKKIAMLCATKEDESIGKNRLNGYVKALLKNNIKIDENLIMHMTDEYDAYSMRSGYMMTKALLKKNTTFTAIFAVSDMVSIGCAKAIFDHGKKIPEDYSLCGFDGLRNTYYFNPEITTLKQPVEEIANESINALFKMINKKTAVENKLFTGELLKRNSTKEI